LGGRISSIGCSAQPGDRRACIFVRANPFEQATTQLALCVSMAIVGGTAKPCDGFAIIFFDTETLKVTTGYVVLRDSEFLRGGPARYAGVRDERGQPGGTGRS
jgi:hypothetical protein